MTIKIKLVSSRRDLKKFIALPAKIHKNHKNWVPPIYLDDWTFFNPKNNKSFAHCDSILAIAEKNGEVVGRIMGIIHKDYNKLHNESHARFAFFETYDDQEVFKALIDFVTQWGKEKGMEKLVGPLGFSDKDPQGFLIDGFDEPIAIATNCNYKYMPELLEKEGFNKKVDLVVYKIIIPNEEPPVYKRILQRINKNQPNLKVLEFKSRREVKPYIRPVLTLLNETFKDIYGFWPFSQAEMDDFANRYLYLINPRFIKVITNGQNELAAFIIGMSDISKGIQKSKGKLLPFGFIHLLLAGKKTDQLNLLLGGIHPKYQGKGLDVMLGMRMFESARLTGKTTMDSHLEMEGNTKVRAEMERVGGKVYKRYRVFQKTIP